MKFDHRNIKEVIAHGHSKSEVNVWEGVAEEERRTGKICDPRKSYHLAIPVSRLYTQVCMACGAKSSEPGRTKLPWYSVYYAVLLL